jgi:hypothetical protein
MKEPKTCIRITGTRTGKLRARVEYSHGTPHHFEVTIGGEKWKTLDRQLRLDILERAARYHYHLKRQLVAALAEEEKIYACVGCQRSSEAQQRKFCEDCRSADKAIDHERERRQDAAMWIHGERRGRERECNENRLQERAEALDRFREVTAPFRRDVDSR